jgi:hypothetical protein
VGGPLARARAQFEYGEARAVQVRLDDPVRGDTEARIDVFALTLAWERRLTRRRGEPLLDLPLFGDRAFAAGTR